MSVEQPINPQDYELLSAYIDGELTDAERETLEQRLTTETFLQQELNSLRNTVNLINQLPTMMTAPRDFTLTPEMITPSNVIPLQPRRRRVRPDYLSLVASVLLMLFGVMFMLSELSQPQAFLTDTSAPASSAPSAEKIEVLDVANAPTEDQTQQVERAIIDSGDANATMLDESAPTEGSEALLNQTLYSQAEEPTIGGMGDDSALGNIEGSNANDGVLEDTQTNDNRSDDSEAENDLAFAFDMMEESDDDADIDGESTLETFAFEEAEEEPTDGIEFREALSDDDTSDDELADESPPEIMAGTTLAVPQTTSDTNIPSADGAASDANDDTIIDTFAIESATTEEALEEIDELPTPTLIPPPIEPIASSPADTITGLQIGVGLIGIGFLLLMGSLLMIRRNRS